MLAQTFQTRLTSILRSYTKSVLSYLNSQITGYLPQTAAVIFTLLLTSGCSLVNDYQAQQAQQALLKQYPDIASRIKQVEQLNHWSVSGKVGFIEKDHTQGASFTWTLNSNNHSQQLDLTTYLGINLLHIKSSGNQHTIKIMGEQYQGENLNDMIRSLAGINLPTNALSYWLKGLPYQLSDRLTYQQQSHLPEKLTSQFEGQQWQVHYLQHRMVSLPTGEQVALASKLRIYQGDLTIKLNINTWKLL